jgi:shikimate kinase
MSPELQGPVKRMAPKIILTGFMATGKSTVARQLARRLQWRLIDCDVEISTRAGKPIQQIFRDFGEAYFRTLERNTIADITSDPARCAQCGHLRPAVIATGGGVIIDPQNYAALRDCGVIVCLSARPDVIARRVANSIKLRPLLAQSGTPLKQRIAELIEQRREAYALATFTVDTSERTVDQVVDAIINTIAKNYPMIVRHMPLAPRTNGTRLAEVR